MNPHPSPPNTNPPSHGKSKEHIEWDPLLPGFGLRIFPNGKRSYIVQYRFAGGTRRRKIGDYESWTLESARMAAEVQLKSAASANRSSKTYRRLDKGISVEALCEFYLSDLQDGLVLGKTGRPKKASTIVSDVGRIRRHIIPLLGQLPVANVTRCDVQQALRDIASGKTAKKERTTKLRGVANVRGGSGTAARTIGLLGGIMTYAVEKSMILVNPVRGVRRPRDKVRNIVLAKSDYQALGQIFVGKSERRELATVIEIAKLLALTGARRGEIVNLRWDEVCFERSCLELRDSKTGRSVRALGLPALEILEGRAGGRTSPYVFPGLRKDKPFGGLPGQWRRLFAASPLDHITPHTLRHSFATVANALGFTEATVASLLGHAQSSVTSRYIHTIDESLVAAADRVAGYIQAMLDGTLPLPRATTDKALRREQLGCFLAPHYQGAFPAAGKPQPSSTRLI